MSGQRSSKGRALFYTRDSGGEHDRTPAEYVGWAQRQARELGLAFSGTAEAINEMMKGGIPESGDLFFDFCVQGHLLSRPALDALKAEVIRDRAVSHILSPRRDRLARPDNPVDGINLENELRRMGVWLIYFDKALEPITKKARQNLGEMIVSLVDFDQSGRFRQDLAEKMIYAQLSLAKSGFSTGGRPPYGYRRWLVDESGNPIRQLDAGEIVRKRGNHVMWLPGPEEELDLIRRIMTMLETLPATEVARRLTAEGIPSPDAGRSRTDHGVEHPVLGIWHATTLTGIARHPLNLALVTYGRRSMGDQLRMTPAGPRPLDEQDERPDGKPKVIQNPSSARVVVPARFEPIVPAQQVERLLSILDQRAGSQRGKPRSKNQATNPLGGRIFDIACSWPMYRQPYRESFRYTCGLYQQSHAQQCAHNHVDGVTVTRFVLSAIRQRLLAGNRLSRLKEKIEARARIELSKQNGSSRLESKRTELEQIRSQLARAKQNLALAANEEEYRAISGFFSELKSAEQRAEREFASLDRPARPVTLETEVNKAQEVIPKLTDLAANASNLAALGQLFGLLNVQVYLRFQAVQKKRRIENKMAGGVLAWGNASSPIEKYAGPTSRRRLGQNAAQQNNPGAECDSGITDVVDSDGRDKSSGNVSRGDWRSFEPIVAAYVDALLALNAETVVASRVARLSARRADGSSGCLTA